VRSINKYIFFFVGKELDYRNATESSILTIKYNVQTSKDIPIEIIKFEIANEVSFKL